MTRHCAHCGYVLLRRTRFCTRVCQVRHNRASKVRFPTLAERARRVVLA